MSEPKRPLVFTLFFVGFWSLITLVFDGMLVANAYRQTRAKGYPVVTGLITRSEVSVHHGDDSTTYGVDVEYKFEVAGEGYVSDRYRYGQMSSSDDSAQKIVDSLPVGKRVDVYYNPADPTDCVLVVGVQSSDLFLALFLTPFNLVMVGGWCALVMMLLPGLGRLLTGPPRAIGRGFKRRLVLEPVPRVIPAAAVLGISSFISIFVVGFGFGFDPPMTVIKTTWAIVLGLAVAMLTRRPRFSLRGKGLVIDDVENTLALSDDQKAGKTVVPLRSIVDIEAAPQGSGYEVLLVYLDEEKDECQSQLIKVGDRERAENLAIWLRDQVMRSARQ